MIVIIVALGCHEYVIAFICFLLVKKLLPQSATLESLEVVGHLHEENFIKVYVLEVRVILQGVVVVFRAKGTSS